MYYTRFSALTNYKMTLESTNARFEVSLLWIIVVLPSHLRQLALPFLFLRAICFGQPIFALRSPATKRSSDLKRYSPDIFTQP